jgi:acetylornithine deacetylase
MEARGDGQGNSYPESTVLTDSNGSSACSSAEEAVLRWIDAHSEDVVRFLQKLVRVPSVNPWFHDRPGPSREDEVQELIAQRLRALGAEVELWEPDAQALSKYRGRPGYYEGRVFKGRPNLAATLPGTGGGRSLLLFGHVDVVKAGSGWTVPPFSGERRDGRIFGRGTADMKGGLAAMVMALEAIYHCGLKTRGPVLVGAVVDEEAGGMGTLAFVDRGYRADACILGEPTNLTVAPLCRGILWGRLIIEGRSGHIEMPQGDWRTGGAVDAIEKARLFMYHFDRLNSDWALRKTHPLLPIPCQLYIAQIQAGEYPTAFANRAELVFNAQYLPSERDAFGLGGNVRREIEEFVQAVARTDPWLQQHPPHIEWLVDADCAETPGDHPLVKACTHSLRRLGHEPKVEGQCSHTDMGWLVNVGIPTVNFGPGEPRVAHQHDEHILESDLLDATRAIALTVLNWCGVAPA